MLSEDARVTGLAAIVAYETARMTAENSWRQWQGKDPIYVGEAWHCHEADVLRALLDGGA